MYCDLIICYFETKPKKNYQNLRPLHEPLTTYHKRFDLRFDGLTLEQFVRTAATALFDSKEKLQIQN